MSEISEFISTYHPCADAVTWLEAGNFGSLQDAWTACPRVDWMLWALDKLNPGANDAELRLFAWAAAEASAGDAGYTAWDAARDVARAAARAAWASAGDAGYTAWAAARDVARAERADLLRRFIPDISRVAVPKEADTQRPGPETLR